MPVNLLNQVLRKQWVPEVLVGLVCLAGRSVPAVLEVPVVPFALEAPVVLAAQSGPAAR